jgi:hypothetical protein
MGEQQQVRWESVLTRLHWPNLSKKEAKKELLLGSGLLDKDNTKQNLKLTWLADRYLLETLFFFMDLIVNVLEG